MNAANFNYALERAGIWLLLALQQFLSLISTCKKLWWGGLMLAVYILIEQVFDAPSLFTLTAETYQYRKGILTLMMLAWVLLLASHVLKRQQYVVGNDDSAIESFEGNANWVSIAFALLAMLFFWILGTSKLTLIILGPLQFVPFFMGTDYKEQADQELPRLINFTLVALAVWIVAFQ